MNQEFSFLFWLYILLQPVLGFLLLLFQHLRIKKLLHREKGILREMKMTDAMVRDLERQVAGASVLPLTESGPGGGDKIWSLLEYAQLAYIQYNHRGEITRMNPFARQSFGFSESENEVSIRDLCDRKSIARASAFRKKFLDGKNPGSFQLSVPNKFGEILNAELFLFGKISNHQEFLVAGLHLVSTGYGQNGSFGVILESILNKSGWPLIMLRKTGRYGGWRNNRVAWISASAGLLLDTDSFRASGLPLEVLSSSLSSLLTDYSKSKFRKKIWQNPVRTDELYLIYPLAEADFLLLLMKPVSKKPDEFPKKKSGELHQHGKISFQNLMEITEDDPEFLKVLLSSYLIVFRESRSEFRNALEQHNPERLRFLHHKVKATIRTFGLKELEAIYNKAQSKMESATTDDTKQLKSIIAEYNAVCSETENVFQDFARNQGISIS